MIKRSSFSVLGVDKASLIFLLFVVVYFAILVIGIGWGLPSQDRHQLLTFDRVVGAEEIDRMSLSREKCAAHHTLSSAMLGGINRGSSESLSSSIFPRECVESAELSFRRFLFFGTAQDESRVFHSLSRMNPAAFDFHPRRFENGTAYLYPIGGLMFFAEKLGYVNLTSSISTALEHPENIRRLYLLGRLVSVAALLGTLLILFQIGERFVHGRVGLIAAIAYGSFGTVYILALQTRIHVVAAFWATLVVYWILSFSKRPRTREILYASVFLGIGIGTAIHVALLGVAIALIVIFSPLKVQRKIGLLAISGLAVLATFVITNPYSLIDSSGFWLWWSTYLTPAEAGGHGYSPHSWWMISKGFQQELHKQISVVQVPFFGMLFAGVLYALFNKNWEWNKLAICLIFSVVIAATIGKASGRFLLFMWPLACLQMAILVDRILEGLDKRKFAKWCLLVLVFFPSYYVIGQKTVGLYVHQTEKKWLSQSIDCLEDLGIKRGQSVGIFDYPRPNSFPPFPFIGTKLIQGSNIEKERPNFVVVRDLEKDMLSWASHSARPLYERGCAVIGAFSPVNGYMEQTISIYRKRSEIDQ